MTNENRECASENSNVENESHASANPPDFDGASAKNDAEKVVGDAQKIKNDALSAARETHGTGKDGQSTEKDDRSASGEERGLTRRFVSEKSRVLELLAMGRSMKETAEAAGVSRSAIYKWLKQDAGFRAAYNEWQNSVQQNARARLLALVDVAVDAVAGAMGRGDAKMGMELLTKMKVFEEKPTDRPTRPEEARQEMDFEEKKRRVKEQIARIDLNTEKATAETARDLWEGESKQQTVTKKPEGSSLTVKKTAKKRRR